MNKKSIQVFIASIFAIIIAIVLLFVFNREKLTQPVVKINGHIWDVEIVSSPEAVKQGLSDRKTLKDSTGMLFSFDPPAAHSFWMKNMHFPLDIVWIKDNRIVRIDENLDPEGEQPANIYPSYAQISKVLEINAGEAQKYHLKVGDLVIQH